MDEAAQIREIIRRIKQVEQVSDTEDFFATGFLDSFDIINLVDELEKTFNMKIKGEDIIEESFKSIETLAKLVMKMKHE